jgi:nucleoside-diphosphate-sugar epimerase
MTLVCQAFLSGRIRVIHPESERTFLCMEDLVRAITILIQHSNKAKKNDLFHLQSFSASISNIANAIASHTGAYIDALDHPRKEDSYGFALNTSKFRTTFDFVFGGDQNQVITKLIEDAPRMCLGRKSHVDKDSISCVVCGSRVMHTVIDLHSQPLANDF